MKRVLIIGGGISGLATAYYLQQHARRDGPPLQCILLERAARFGGLICTEKVDSFVVEGGPDSFLSQKPWGLELCHDLGLSDQIIYSNDAQRKTYVLSGRGLVEFPEGLMLMLPTRWRPFLQSPLISWPGKIRMALDWVIPRRSAGADESVASFVRRRLGREALDKIAEPLIGGIYGGDVERLSLQCTFPFLMDLEAQHGSILRGILRRPAPAATPGANPHSLFVSLRGGMFDLIKTLMNRMDGVLLQPGCGVRAIQRSGPHSYLVYLVDGSQVTGDALVVATPAPESAELLASVQPVGSDYMRRLPYSSSVTISLGYDRRDLVSVPNGFGVIIPRLAQRPIIACTWTSNKFPLRADGNHILLRAFAGGVLNPQLVDYDDAALIGLAREELRVLTGLTAKPVLSRVFRWRQAMPHYPVGYADLWQGMTKALAETPGLFVAGNAIAGVGIPDCIHTASRVSDQVLEYLRSRA